MSEVFDDGELVDVNEVDKNGSTALHLAAWYGKFDFVKTLLAANGVEVNQADSNGRTALTLAAENGRLDVVTMLLADTRVEVNQAEAD